MKKYLVDVYLPTAGLRYDVYLPTGKTIGETITLLVSLFESLSSGSFKGSADSLLINADNGEPFDRRLTVYDAGIKNASKLILIGK